MGMNLLRRTTALLGVLLAVTTAFAAGFLLGPGRGGGTSVLLTGQELGAGLSCDRLRQWYVDHALEQVTAWGWQGPPFYRGLGVRGGLVPQLSDARSAAPSAAGSELDTATTSQTGTNVQEADVDEPDTVKTDDGLLVRIHDGLLETYDVSGARPVHLGSAPLGAIGDPQLLLSGDRVVVVGSQLPDPAAGAPLFPPPAHTWVRTYDVSDAARPLAVDSRVYDGRLVTARQTGDVVRLVLSGWLPPLDFVQPSSVHDQVSALAHNRNAVRASTIQDWLPAVASYDPDTSAPSGSPASTPLVDCADVAVPTHFGGLGTMTVVGFHADAPVSTDATAVATDSTLAYMSAAHLYVATAPVRPTTCCLMQPLVAPGPEALPVSRPDTRLYAFDLSDTSARYVGGGVVDGSVADSSQLDEHDGVLRVAVQSASGLSSTSVVELRSEGGRLAQVGRLDGLGMGQQLQSVRWFDDLAVLVTFQQVDPFYVLDLTDPASPRLLGALHLPGWSSYLHPVGPHLVLGLGQTAPQIAVRRPLGIPQERAKATLFDISDPARPRAVGTVRYPLGSTARAGFDPHQVTWLPGSGTLLTVVSGGYGAPRAWVSVLTMTDGALHDRLLPVPQTADVDGVRTVPVADSRVVLVAGGQVRFLPV
jgi:hypothetical protein